MSDFLAEMTGGDTELAADVAAFEETTAGEVDKAEAEIEAAAETPAETAPETTEPKKTGENVPLPVFLDLKNDLKEAKAELRALREQQQAIQNQPRPQPQDTRPAFAPTVTYENDPAEFLRQKLDHQESLIAWQERHLANTAQMTAHQQQAMTQQAQVQQFHSAVQSAEDQFRATAPDYDNAVEHIRQSRLQEAQLLLTETGQEWGPQTQAQVSQAIVNEFAQVAAAAMRSGRNPAQAVYALAKARGYQPPSQHAETKLAQIERGMQASRTVSNVSGGRPVQQESSGDWLTEMKRGAGYA